MNTELTGVSGHGRPRTAEPAGTTRRVLAAIVVLVIAFGAGYLSRRPAQPLATAAPGAGTGHADHDAGGLQISQDGYALRAERTTLSVGRTSEFTFQIIGPSGSAVTAFQPNHEKFLHLVVVRRDFTGYRHLHPAMDLDGTWRIALRPDSAGDHRIFVDFQPARHSRNLILGMDIAVPGSYRPEPLPPEQTTLLVDGYTVTVSGSLQAGRVSEILVLLGRDGRPVEDIQPYLGSYGHLVALRRGDLAYLHVHPTSASTPSSVVPFSVVVPSAGAYRLFFEFRHADVVRTVAFTVTAVV